ncbi:hypothetical protein BJ508DRAFT_331397 [Ascobolus immersus RN42]|uniref:Uncharacterized protein n=1 Tax=Ascobolus immersus RN42 TaxID=1160509 RepID=A0A3N4HQK8_ASCIM|nr:hypothetical protein BJ508DRAFT_331397 [Ascobolus immersus RN42]
MSNANSNSTNNKNFNAIREFFLEAEKENIAPGNNYSLATTPHPRRPPYGFEDQAELDTARFQFFFPYTANNRPSRKAEPPIDLHTDSEGETEILTDTELESVAAPEIPLWNEVQTLHSDPPFLPSQQDYHVALELNGPWGDTCSRRVQPKYSCLPLKRKGNCGDFGGIVDDEILDKRFEGTPPAQKRYRTRKDLWPEMSWLELVTVNEFDGFPDWYWDESDPGALDSDSGFSDAEYPNDGFLPSDFEPQDWAWRPVEGRSKTPPPPASLPRDDCCWSPAPTI